MQVTIERPQQSKQNMNLSSNTESSNAAARPTLEGKPGSRRSLLQARSLSRRFVRTLSEMMEDDTVEENSCSSTEGDNNDDTEEITPSSYTSRSKLLYARASSARNMALVKSLSKRLLKTISQIIDEDNNDSLLDESNRTQKDKEESHHQHNSDPAFEDGERPKMLARSLSKRLIRTISQIVDDSSVDRSLDIFGEVSNHDPAKRAAGADIPKWAVVEDATESEEDGFDAFMRSLLKDESFHNSLNDWMGSLSDVFDENKGANGTRLSAKDLEAMETNVQHMRDLGQYLRKSLSCRNLVPSVEEDEGHSAWGRRPHFRRCQSFRESNKSQLSEVAECEWEDAAVAPSLVIPASPAKVFSADTTQDRPLVSNTGLFMLQDEVSSVFTDTEGASLMTDHVDETEHTFSSMQNAALPVRMPSPVKSPRKLQIILSDDMKQNAARPQRIASPNKAPRTLNLPQTFAGLQCASLE